MYGCVFVQSRQGTLSGDADDFPRRIGVRHWFIQNRSPVQYTVPYAQTTLMQPMGFMFGQSNMWGSPGQFHVLHQSVLPFWPFFAGPFLVLVELRAGRLLTHSRSLGRCPTCSYDLTGNTNGVCPECGSALVGKVGA